MSERGMEMAVRQALAALAPIVIRHGAPIALNAMAAAIGMLLVERHRATLRQSPQALQEEMRVIQGAIEDGVAGSVEGLSPERLP